MKAETNPTEFSKEEKARRKILKEKINTASKEELSAIDTAEIKGLMLEEAAEKRLKKLEKAVGGIKEAGETGKKKVIKKGGDPAVVEKSTAVATAAAAEVTEEAAEKMEAVIEAGGESIKSTEYKNPGLSESYQEAENEIKAELQTNKTPENTEPKARSTDETIEQLETSLIAARATYFETYKKFQEERGWFSNVKNKMFGGEVKAEDIAKKNPELARKLTETKAAYNAALVERGNAMLGGGSTPAAIMEKLVIGERELRNKEEVALVPERVASLLAKAGEKYMMIKPPYARQVLSTTLVAAGMLATGHIGAAGAGMYVGSRLVRSAIGQLAVSIKNKLWKTAKEDVTKVNQEFQAKTSTQEFGTKGLTMEALEKMQQSHNEKLSAERGARLKHLAIDAGIRLAAGFGTGLAQNYLSGGEVPVDEMKGTGGGQDGHGKMPWEYGKGESSYEQIQQKMEELKHPHGNFEFKHIEDVKYSAKGSIDTWVQVKAHIRDAYKGVDAAKIPPAYQHILNSRADSLAQEFGEWKPGEANESLNMLKGSSITFDDKTGEIVSHSLKNAQGAAENHTLASMDASGKPIYSGETNERFFHYGGNTEGSIDEPLDPGLDGDPKFESGIDAPIEPETDSNGFWADPSHHTRFESHVTHVDDSANAPHDPAPAPHDPNEEDWTGKRHSKLWWKRHPDGIDHKLQAHHAPRPPRFPFAPGNASREIDDAFRQTAYNSGGYVDEHPMMNPGNPGGAPSGYQHTEIYGSNLANEQVTRMLNNPVRSISREFLNQAVAAHDAALPLYKVINHFQSMYPIHGNESLAEWLGHVKAENQAYFAGINVDAQDWFTRNGFWG